MGTFGNSPNSLLSSAMQGHKNYGYLVYDAHLKNYKMEVKNYKLS